MYVHIHTKYEIHKYILLQCYHFIRREPHSYSLKCIYLVSFSMYLTLCVMRVDKCIIRLCRQPIIEQHQQYFYFYFFYNLGK